MNARALGGGALDEGALLRIIYVDEAGIGDPAKEPYAVVAGVIVFADRDLGGLEGGLRQIVEKHIPKDHWDTFVFHAKELFNGGGNVFKREGGDWHLERRLMIAGELTSLIAKSSITVAVGDVKRAELIAFEDDFLRNPNVAAHAMAYTLCLMNCENWMREKAADEVCMLVVEDNQSARGALRTLHRMHQDEDFIARAFSAEERNNIVFPFRKIKQDPLFQPKAPGSVLALADYAAYVYKRYLMDTKSALYGQFFLPMVHRFFMGV